jgi:hypothetical protein
MCGSAAAAGQKPVAEQFRHVCLGSIFDRCSRLWLSAHVRFAPKANLSVQSKAQKKAPATGARAE